MSRRFREGLVRRDRYGRFAVKGSKLYAVRGARRKLIGKSRGGPREPHRQLAGLKMYAGEAQRKGQGKKPRALNFRRTLRTVGTGRRRRGMSIRQISRVHQTTRTPDTRTHMYSALGRHGLGTGRRRSATRVGKVPTPQVRRSRGRIMAPRRRRQTSR